jgi:hypothetical protein
LPQAASAEEFTPGEQRGAMARVCINRACLDPLGKVLLWLMFFFFLTINIFVRRFCHYLSIKALTMRQVIPWIVLVLFLWAMLQNVNET